MATAKTIVTAGGVPYEITDKQNTGETLKQLADRHLRHVLVFVTTLGDDLEDMEMMGFTK